MQTSESCAQGFYWDAREVFVSRDGTTLAIKMYNGKEYRSDDAQGRAMYDQAKLHLQVRT